MTHALPAEFRLALACCRAAATGKALTPPSCAIDWARFLLTVERHRIAGLAWRALAPTDIMPAEPRERLSASARQVAATSLRAARDSARLDEAFAAAAIDRLFLKGASLGALVYADPTIKAAWDIDLLVAPQSVEAAAAILDRLGYRLVLPRDGQRLVAWHRRRRESVWAAPDGGPHVELHTGLADNPLLVPSLGLTSSRQRVAVMGGPALETFATAELFAYLCVHGGASSWFRLKWLADLVALLAKSGIAESAGLYERSQALGAHRCAGQALLLANRLFGTAIEPSLLTKLQSSRAHRHLARLATRALLAPEPTSRRLGTLPLHVSQFALSPLLRFKARELRTQIAVAIANRLG